MKDDGAEPALRDGAVDRELSHEEMISEGDSLPAPDYADLLDTAWLTRQSGAADLDESVVDEVGVMLDLGDTADDDVDVASALEFDVGSLLTSLAPESFGPWTSQPTDASTARETSPSEREQLAGEADESLDDAFAMRALHELLLPESRFPGSVHPEDSVLPDSLLSDSLLPAPLPPGEMAEADRGDDEVGDDERFPVFDAVDGTPVSREDDATSDVELD